MAGLSECRWKRYPLQMSDQTNLPLRPNVCMLVVNTTGKVLLGERKGSPGLWQFPQGGVEPGLSLEENVRKELLEELGISNNVLGKIIRLRSTKEYLFDKIPSYAVGKWAGQSQSFWVVQFLGSDSDINLHAHHTPEFTDFQWCTPVEVIARAEPKRVPGYRAPLEELEELYALLGVAISR